MRRPTLFLLVLSFLAFISLGLPDTVLGVAWPFVRGRFGLEQAAMSLVLTFGVGGYFLSGLLAGRLVKAMGVGALLAASSALVALGLTGYAIAPRWWLFFPMASVIGLGSGAIDSGLNAYAARHFPVSHVNWLHASWSLGATAGPAMMTAVLARGAPYTVGYTILAAALGSMALAFVGTRRSWDDAGAPAPVDGPGTPAAGAGAAPPHAPVEPADLRTVLRNGRVWLHIAIFFVYTGVETGTGAWCFTVLRDGRGLSIESAGAWTTIFWGALLAGRVGLGFVVDRIGPDRLLRVVAATAVLGIAAFAGLPGLPGRLGLVVLGVSLAPIFPTLMARTPARLGEAATAHAVGFQVSAATLGSAVLPSAYGLLPPAFIPFALTGAALLLLSLHEGLVWSTRERRLARAT